MKEHWEVWHLESANLVAVFDTEKEARASVVGHEAEFSVWAYLEGADEDDGPPDTASAGKDAV